LKFEISDNNQYQHNMCNTNLITLKIMLNISKKDNKLVSLIQFNSDHIYDYLSNLNQF
jgi:hypothetical protein